MEMVCSMGLEPTTFAVTKQRSNPIELRTPCKGHLYLQEMPSHPLLTHKRPRGTCQGQRPPYLYLTTAACSRLPFF